MPKEPAASPFEQWVMGKPTLPLYWVAQPVVKNYPNGHLQAKDCDYRDIPTWDNCSPEQERLDGQWLDGIVAIWIFRKSFGSRRASWVLDSMQVYISDVTKQWIIATGSHPWQSD